MDISVGDGSAYIAACKGTSMSVRSTHSKGRLMVELRYI